MNLLKSLLIVLLLFTGCGEESPTQTQIQSGGIALSLVTGFQQNSITTTVNVDARIEIKVSTALNAATVNENSVYIKDTNGARFPTYVSLDGSTIIVQAKAHLLANSQYFLVVTTALESTTGLHLTADESLSFTTGSTIVDGTPPTYVTWLPKAAVALPSIDIDGQMYYQFSEKISGVNISDSSVSLYDNNTSTNVAISVGTSDNLIVIKPNTSLPLDHLYTMSYVGSSVEDLVGNILSGSISDINFTTVSKTKEATVMGAGTYDAQAVVNTIDCPDAGTEIFIAANNGLHILDFDVATDLISFDALVSSDLVGKVYNLDVNYTSKRAYLGTSKGAYIVDFTNKTAPTVLGSYLTTSPVFGIFADEGNDLLYIAASDQGLIKANMSNISNILPVLSITNGVFFDVLVDSTRVILAAYDQGVISYDLSLSPTGAPLTVNNGVAKSIFFDGSIVIASGGIGGLDAGDLLSTPTYANARLDSFVNVIKDTGSSGLANVEGVGIAQFTKGTGSLNFYYTFDFDVKTFGYWFNGVSESRIIVADQQGKIYVGETLAQ